MNATTTQTRRNRNTRGSTQNATTPLPFQTLETMGFVTGTPAPPAEPARRLRRLRPLREIQPTMDDFSTEFVTPDPKILARLKELRQELRSKRRAILLASQYKKVDTRYNKQFRQLVAEKREHVVIDRSEIKFSEALAIAVRYPSRLLLTVDGKEHWTMTPENAWRLKILFEKLDRGELDEESSELIETSDNGIYEIGMDGFVWLRLCNRTKCPFASLETATVGAHNPSCYGNDILWIAIECLPLYPQPN